MASDLISRKALMGDLLRVFCEDCNSYNGIRCRACLMDDAIGYVEAQPTVDAVEVVHGEWIKHKINPEAMRLFHQDGIAEAMGENSIFWTCSECKSWGTPAHNYCQNCGAKMDGGENGNCD